MGIPILSGQDLPLEFVPGAALPVLVNEQFSRKYLNGEAVGRTFSMGARQAHVIGLVGTTKYRDLVEEPQPIFYLPFEGGRSSSPNLLQVRTNGNPEQAIEQLRALLKAVDPSVTINSVITMEMQIDEILGRERLLAFLSTLLGGVAVALSAIGLYGVLAFSVVRRTREIGIRMAIGAPRSGVVAMFLKEGGWLVGGGLLLGIPLALACGRLAESLLYGLQPQDTTTMLGATGLLLLIALAAALIPSWRAARIDPIRALRHE
jgi:cell division protein FtsX